MNLKVKLIALIILIAPSYMMAANPFADADSAYYSGQYEQAIGMYRELIDINGTSPGLLFNLGNAYAKADDYGNAMLCYERARKLDPDNDRILNNINYLRTRIDDKNKAELKGKQLSILSESPTFFQSIHSAISVAHSSDTWALFAAISFVLAVTFVALYIFTIKVSYKKVGFFSASVFLLFSFVFIAFSLMSARRFHDDTEGVITAFSVALATEPKEDSNAATAPLTRGTKMQIISEEEDSRGEVSWYKVRLNSDYIGWIKASDFVKI